ncbi:MAG: PAS domain S-box protein [Gammaproteobacteria bacterium]|nr:PAS domain S-box protein [Gammaproteobacteria bacterium]
MDLLTSFFDGSYMPHGHCYLWRPEILWTHVLSDILIAASYFSIPVLLFLIKKKRTDWKFKKVFLLFSLFIFLCGVTHLLSIFTIWHGIYGIHGVAKIATAVVSVLSAVVLFKLIPNILSIPSVEQIETANRLVAEKEIEKSRLQAERESERLFKLSLNAAPVGLLAIGKRGVIRIVNDEINEIFGFQNSELVDMEVSSLFVESNFFSQEVIDRLTSEQGPNFRYISPSIIYAKKKNGDLVPVEVRAHGETYLGEQIIFMSVSDQSYKVQAEEVRSYLSEIVSSCDDAIIGKELDGTVTHWNPAAETLYGYDESEMVGESILKIVPQELHQQVFDFLNELKSGKKIKHIETIRVKKDGSLVNVMLTISPVKDFDGKVIGASVIARDITENINAKKALERQNRALERSNKELESFAFIASHDLKEPLRKIISFGQLIKEEVEAKLEPDTKDYLQYMISATVRMQSLLQSLLTYSRVTSRAKPFENVALNQVIKTVLTDLELKIEETEADIQVVELPEILAEPSQMYQLFQNLISNSLKYRKSDETPRIKIYSEQVNIHQVTVFVEDNGIGFEQKYSEQIFEMFKRLHGRSEYEGTGVGLAICRKIVEHHGGTIMATSSPGEGTVIELHFNMNE